MTSRKKRSATASRLRPPPVIRLREAQTEEQRERRRALVHLLALGGVRAASRPTDADEEGQGDG